MQARDRTNRKYKFEGFHILGHGVDLRDCPHEPDGPGPGRLPEVEGPQALNGERRLSVLDEHRIGSIEAGKLADMVVLEEDGLCVPPETIMDMTIVDGKVVYRREDA